MWYDNILYKLQTLKVHKIRDHPSNSNNVPHALKHKTKPDLIKTQNYANNNYFLLCHKIVN